MSVARRLVYTVLVGDRTVVCDYDETCTSAIWPVMRFSVLDEDSHMAVHLAVTAAFRASSAVGDAVASVDVSCGAVDDLVTQGSTDALALVIAAIPHVYADERDVEVRRVLRSLYRRLRRADAVRADRSTSRGTPLSVPVRGGA